MKKTVFVTLAAAPVFALVRLLQYIFVIGPDGYYESGSMLDTIFEYSGAAVLTVSALYLVASLIFEKKGVLDPKTCAIGKSGAAVSFVIAALILFEAGFGAAIMLTDKKIDWLVIAGVLAAVYFAVAAYDFAGGKNGIVANIFGIFAPIYFCVRGIVMFFSTVSTANASFIRLQMVTVGAAALFCMAFVGARAGAKVSARRMAAVCSFYLICSVGFVASGLFELLRMNETSLLTKYLNGESVTAFISFLCQVSAFAVLAFITLMRVRVSTKPEPETETEPEPEVEVESETETETETETEPDRAGLDVYIDDIPEPSERQE